MVFKPARQKWPWQLTLITDTLKHLQKKGGPYDKPKDTVLCTYTQAAGLIIPSDGALWFRFVLVRAVKINPDSFLKLLFPRSSHVIPVSPIGTQYMHLKWKQRGM